MDSVVFARRQSPNWASLSADYRAGKWIDPARFIPDHFIPEFPTNIEQLVELWNERFRIDFFTCRSLLAGLSRRNLERINCAKIFTYQQVDEIAALAKHQDFILFFHDDDDFFSPRIFDQLNDADAWHADSCVFPLLRVANNIVTYVKEDHQVDFVWGQRVPFHYRFHTNNYGISSRICDVDTLKAMKDHMQASRYADEAHLSEQVFPFNISATVKTPCAASSLPELLNDPGLFLRNVEVLAEILAWPALPDELSWLIWPLQIIGKLFSAVSRSESLPIEFENLSRG